MFLAAEFFCAVVGPGAVEGWEGRYVHARAHEIDWRCELSLQEAQASNK